MKLPSAQTIAAEFCRQLHKAIGTRNVALVNRRNARRNDSSCASHDFCDANMVMDAAFQKITGKDTDALSYATDPHFKGEGCMSDDVLAIWSEAWSLASAARFSAEDVGKVRLYTVQYSIQVNATNPIEAAKETLRHIQQNGCEAIFAVKPFHAKDRPTPKGYTLVDLSLL